MHKQATLTCLLSMTITVLAACSQNKEVSQDSAPAPTTPVPISQATEQEPAASLADQKAPSAGAISLRSIAGGQLEKRSQYYPGVDQWRLPSEPLDRETYAHYQDNPLRVAAEHPISTFSIDVDTGAYANVRRLLRNGRLPRTDAVRVEEMINYFDYQYPGPSAGDPFAVFTEMAPTPWNPETRLLHIGIQGYRVEHAQLPASNLVFLIDVSGSMRAPNKLPLLKNALKLLARQLRTEDRVSIVVYAGASGVVLEPVPGDQSAKIEQALERLSAGGSTNGGAGIRLAYSLARQAFIKKGINRVILATDGDFNVGTVNFEQLKDLVKRERESGVTLTTLGFGSGNYNDRLLEQIADVGNGNYAYIDTLHEARKVLVEELGATLQVIAKDVKIQIEFNPQVVAEYRLIGYENRTLRREDFNNDKVDAGDIGAGHTVTALYEVTLVGSKGRLNDPLRYNKATMHHTHSDELALLRLRYKIPAGTASKLIERPLQVSDIKRDLAQTSENFRFAAAVAAFGQLLRGGHYTGRFNYPSILDLARTARGADPSGYRGEFLALVGLAESLSGKQAQR